MWSRSHWISERKDVLCAFFWFATLWACLRYTERPGFGRYASALALFSLGLMSKSMIVTLPFLLFLLDVWPLRRAFSRKLIAEKLPFMVLWFAVAAITLVAQQQAHGIRTLSAVPLMLRFENALISLVIYIADTLRPVRLWIARLSTQNPADMAGGYGRRRDCRRFGFRLASTAQETLPDRRMVLVSGHSRAGNRTVAGRSAGPRRPLYVRSDGWPLHHAPVGSRRRCDALAAVTGVGLGFGSCCRDGQSGRSRVELSWRGYCGCASGARARSRVLLSCRAANSSGDGGHPQQPCWRVM
jgi:hypothetical protein